MRSPALTAALLVALTGVSIQAAQAEPPPAVVAPEQAVAEPQEGGVVPPATASAPQRLEAAPQQGAPAATTVAAVPRAQPSELRPSAVKASKREEDSVDDSTEGEGKKEPKRQSLKAKGRLFILSEIARRHVQVVNALGMPEDKRRTSLDLSVQSARVGLAYRSSLKWLSAAVQLELTGKVTLKDAYAQAAQKQWEVRAGQFKMPISALELESSWMLPIVHRGFVQSILVDRLDIAGRRPGLTGSLQGPGALKPRLTLGVFQGSELTALTADDRNTDLIQQQGTKSQSGVARAQVKLGDVKLGASYEHRVGAPAFLKTRHFWTAGADLRWVYDHSSGGLRVWGDFLSGASWYEDPSKPVDGSDAVFMTARLLAAYRFGGVEKEDLYIEPFLYAALHDPDTDVTADQALEGMLGLSAGFWDRARLTLQGEVVKVSRNFPVSYAMGSDPDRIGLLLQGGVAF